MEVNLDKMVNEEVIIHELRKKIITVIVNGGAG